MTGAPDDSTEAALRDSFLAPPWAVADWRAVLLHAAAETAGLLAALPGTAAQVARASTCDQAAVQVVLDGLVTVGMLATAADGGYRAAEALPDDDVAAVVSHHAQVISQWAGGLDAALRGEASPRGRRARSPEQLARWYDGLATGARVRAPALVDTCLAAVPGAVTALDLGGGHGEYAAELARRGLRVTLQDLPTAIEAVRDRPAIADHDVTLFAASAHERVPDGPFDLVLCAGVTHIFSAEQNAALAARLAAVVRPGGAVVISTFLRDVDPSASLFAVQMLVVGNGDIHTRQEYSRWYGDAGFVHVSSPPSANHPGRAPLVFQRSGVQAGTSPHPPQPGN